MTDDGPAGRARCRTRRAACAGTLLTVALLTSASTARGQDVAAASEHYHAGLEHYDAGAYATALDEFRASLALVDSPNARLLEARALRALGRLDEAATEYQRTEADSVARAPVEPRFAPTRDTARDELDEIAPQLARVRVRVVPLPTGARVRLGTRELAAQEIGVPLWITPGHVTAEVTAPGYEVARAALDVAAGSRAELALAPRALARPTLRVDARPATRPRTPAVAARAVLVPTGWTTLGVGAAGLVAFGVLALVTNAEFAALDARCHDVPCPGTDATAGADLARGMALESATNAALVAGAVTAGVGLVLLVVAQALGPSRGVTARTPHAVEF